MVTVRYQPDETYELSIERRETRDVAGVANVVIKRKGAEPSEERARNWLAGPTRDNAGKAAVEVSTSD